MGLLEGRREGMGMGGGGWEGERGDKIEMAGHGGGAERIGGNLAIWVARRAAPYANRGFSRYKCSVVR
jgi:hypothetical protein